MSGGVDFLELSDADLGINLGRIKSSMAQLLLDEPGIGSVLEHQGGTGVPKEIARALLPYVGRFDVVPYHLSESVRGERFEELR